MIKLIKKYLLKICLVASRESTFLKKLIDLVIMININTIKQLNN